MKATTRMDRLRHIAAFGMAGMSAFAVDAVVLELLVRSGLSPYLARLAGIALAMVVGWLVNRTWTFRAAGPPHIREFLRYAAVASLSTAINYAVYALVLLSWSGATPLRALVAGTAVAMFASYFGYRLFAFAKVRPAETVRPEASDSARRETE
jgi:putative flippase GtrA